MVFKVNFVGCKMFSCLQHLTLANKITLFRIGVIPFILVFLHLETRLSTFFACILFIIASISDYYDGYFARKSGEVTTLGKFLDPLADKLLVCTILVEMAALGWVSSWIVNIILIREFAVTGLRAIAADSKIIIAADAFGKWKTGFQIAAIIPLSFHFPLFGIPIHEIGTILLYIALVFTICSGVNYFKACKKQLENIDKDKD